MPLYRVHFDNGGWSIGTRVRALPLADHVALAVRKIWGQAAYWAWEDDSTTWGRVFEQLGEARVPETDRPHWGLSTVTVRPWSRGAP